MRSGGPAGDDIVFAGSFLASGHLTRRQATDQIMTPMAAIPLDDSDGVEALPICRSKRKWIADRYRDAAMIAQRYFSDEVPIVEGDMETDRKSMDHIRKCLRCRGWLHKVVPAETLRRQSRLTRYCCASMYVAIEEPDRTDIRVGFELFRGEDPCWTIGGKRTFASYCPWCGQKLPPGPFIEDADV